MWQCINTPIKEGGLKFIGYVVGAVLAALIAFAALIGLGQLFVYAAELVAKINDNSPLVALATGFALGGAMVGAVAYVGTKLAAWDRRVVTKRSTLQASS